MVFVCVYPLFALIKLNLYYRKKKNMITIIILAVVFGLMAVAIIVLSVIEIINIKKTDVFNKKYWQIIDNLNYLRNTNGSDEEIAHFEKEFMNLFN